MAFGPTDRIDRNDALGAPEPDRQPKPGEADRVRARRDDRTDRNQAEPRKIRVSHSDPLIAALVRALGMPPNVRRFELHAEVAMPVRVRCEYFPAAAAADVDGNVIMHVRDYELVPLDTVQAGIDAAADAALSEIRELAERARRELNESARRHLAELRAHGS